MPSFPVLKAHFAAHARKTDGYQSETMMPPDFVEGRMNWKGVAEKSYRCLCGDFPAPNMKEWPGKSAQNLNE